MILSTSFEHDSEALNILFYDSNYSLVIKIEFKKRMDKIFEGNDDYTIKDRKFILDSKKNHCIVETSPLRCKCCLVLIFLCNFDLMVTQ